MQGFLGFLNDLLVLFHSKGKLDQQLEECTSNYFEYFVQGDLQIVQEAF